jgi:hypothetical protein
MAGEEKGIQDYLHRPHDVQEPLVRIFCLTVWPSYAQGTWDHCTAEKIMEITQELPTRLHCLAIL